MKTEIRKTDVVIVGSGLAGLSLAKYLSERSPNLSIVLLSKTDWVKCNTFYAQGGIAVVQDFLLDSFEKHIADTLIAGNGLCNEKVVHHVIKNAPNCLQDLLNWGVEFDKTILGNFDLGLEGGHSVPRIVHQKDQTGQELEIKLLETVKNLKNVTLEASFFVTDLRVRNEICCGITGFNAKNIPIFWEAQAVVLATGGCGQVFESTSNPAVATGDGIAIAQRAGVEIENLNFIQFHPTAIYEPLAEQAFLITEALRGYGAYIVNAKGKRFLKKVHPDAELATRDVISMAMEEEISREKSKNVWLDIRHLDPIELQQKFPKVTHYFNHKKWDFTTELIPIKPAAHYQCGGIIVDIKGKTSLKRLFAIGECSSTGLHGSNRLASNSLLEALVFARELAGYLSKNIEKKSISTPLELDIKCVEISWEEIHPYRQKLKKLMHYEALYGSSHLRKITYKKVHFLLEDFKQRFPLYEIHPYVCETFNLLQTALLIIKPQKLQKFKFPSHDKPILPYIKN